MISIFSAGRARKTYADICQRVRPWLPLLPQFSDDTPAPIPQLEFLKNFLTVTNEIERVLCETEVYSVQRTDYWHRDGFEYVLLTEGPRVATTPLADSAKPL